MSQILTRTKNNVKRRDLSSRVAFHEPNTAAAREKGPPPNRHRASFGYGAISNTALPGAMYTMCPKPAPCMPTTTAAWANR